MGTNKRYIWLAAIAAILPSFLIYVFHFATAPAGSVGTGFIQGDQPSYLAMARANGNSLLYDSPFTPNDSTPRIYFQLTSLVIGIIMRATAWDPGYVNVGYFILFSILMFRITIELAIICDGAPRGLADWLGISTILWGGGFLTLAGWGHYWFTSPHPELGGLWGALVTFDPELGWWFLNLGRNSVYGTEALYHSLFFATVIAILRRYYAFAILIMFIASISHPFTGVQLLLVVGAWAVIDQVTRRPNAPPYWFTAATGLIFFLLLGYHMFIQGYLSAEHRIIHQQYSVDLVDEYLPAASILPAYGVVMILAGCRIFMRRYNTSVAENQTVRFLLMWFLISFLLAKHDLVLPMHQPIHFTRGYIWTPLALLSLPVIKDGFRWAISRRPRIVAVAAGLVLLGFALADNATWFIRQYAFSVAKSQSGVRMTLDEWAVLRRLSAPDLKGRLLLSSNGTIGPLATVYTDLRTWFSHGLLTPYSAVRKTELSNFFRTGEEVATWRQRPLVVVVNTDEYPAASERLSAAGFVSAETFGPFRLVIRPMLSGPGNTSSIQ